jgi:hypothetical protein
MAGGGFRKAGVMAGMMSALRGKGEPVAFEFSLHLQTLAPWPRSRPRRLALRWTRGSKARARACTAL